MLIAVAAAAPETAAPHLFQFVGASNDVAMFVEDTTIVTNGTSKTAWIVSVADPNSDVAKQYPGTYSMMSYQIDCRLRTDAVTHLYIYDADGNVLAEKADPYPFSPVAPLSAGELVFKYVCDGTISTDKVKTLNTVAEVKAFGVYWLQAYDKAQAAGQFNIK